MRISNLIVSALVVTVSCSSTTEVLDQGNGILTTDSSSYTAVPVAGASNSYRLRVVTRFANNTDSTKHLDRCFPTTPYPIYGVDLISPANAEGAAWSPGWACVGISESQLIAIPPHTTRVDTLNLSAPTAADGRTGRPFGQFDGRFRISYGGEESNEFVIRLP